MANIGVKPVRKGMNLVHPLDGALPDEGGKWREDQFTLKRLRDKDIKRVADEDEADEPEPASDKPVNRKSAAKKAAADEPTGGAPPEAAEDPIPDTAALTALAPAQE
jgi:hypothetical protein